MFTNLILSQSLLLIILACIGLGVCAPLVGSFLIVQRKSGIVDSLSHISMLGAGLGIWFKLNPYIFATLLCMIVILGIFEFGQKIPYKEAILSVFTGFSLAFIAIIKKFSGIRINLESIFYGNINSVSWSDLVLILGLVIVIVGLFVRFYKEFVWISIDENIAKTQGIDVKKFRLIFNVVASAVFAVFIQIFGIVIVSIMTIAPVLLSNYLIRGFSPKIVFALVIGLLSLVSGVLISYFWLDYSVSSVFAVMMFLGFVIGYLYKNISAKATRR
jgi:zinc transport system permease protein